MSVVPLACPSCGEINLEEINQVTVMVECDFVIDEFGHRVTANHGIQRETEEIAPVRDEPTIWCRACDRAFDIDELIVVA